MSLDTHSDPLSVESQFHHVVILNMLLPLTPAKLFHSSPIYLEILTCFVWKWVMSEHPSPLPLTLASLLQRGK